MTDKVAQRSYSAVLETLRQRLSEPAPARVQILAGPRQVGKTHLLRRLKEEAGERAVYAAADVPEAASTGWWELQWREAEERAGPDGPGVLLMDEIHYLRDWSRRLKAEHDALVARDVQVHVVVSGSSSLKLGWGARESMAGRFERLELRHWPASELVAQFGLTPERAVEIAVEFGTYPGAVALLGEPERWRSYVRDSIVEPAVGRDIQALALVRKPALLRAVFSIAVGHPAEIVSLQKLRAGLDDAGALETIAQYLRLLEDAYLVAPLSKLAANATRRRAAPPKLVTLNQGILAALGAGSPPELASDRALAGRWIENACIAYAWNAGQEVTYWRAEPLEVDMVTDGSWGRWAVEVKTGAYAVGDLSGLLECCRRYPDFRPLLLCREGDEALARRMGVSTQPWRTYLLSGPPE
ncbi:MAG: AAA family ATPase [Planctomycetota bacterium]|nr:MAG: AAA family ATPase [Planctomycetota bacterium]